MMSTEQQAKSIGGRNGLLTAAIGVIIAQLVMVSLLIPVDGFTKAFLWFKDFEYKSSLIVGVVTMLVSGFLYGRIFGKLIIVKNWNFALAGMLCGFLILVTTTFICGFPGFFSSEPGEENAFARYIIAPFFWISIVGFVPALATGLFFGVMVRKKAKQLASHGN